jgi:hypothetical protein
MVEDMSDEEDPMNISFLSKIDATMPVTLLLKRSKPF